MLVCNNVKKGYKTAHGKEVSVLKDINLSIQKGDIVIISGRSGVGKSTLLNMLSGLDRADSGDIIFEGKNFNVLTNKELTKIRHLYMGIIFQNFNLISSWTVMENIEAALLHSKSSDDEKKNRILKILNELEIKELYNNFPLELSEGQRQRVAVARAIITEPEIIFADEPTGDVDLETAKQIIEQLLYQVNNKNISVIIFTHSSLLLELLKEKCEYRHYILIDGRLIEQI